MIYANGMCCVTKTQPHSQGFAMGSGAGSCEHRAQPGGVKRRAGERNNSTSTLTVTPVRFPISLIIVLSC